LLLTSTQVIPRSKHEEEEDSALLQGKMEELNKNIVRLISETEKLIQEAKQLSERIKSFRRKERTTVGAAA
jgi:predicted  nucleic acid-binding Zn-ribbon protein